MSNSRRNAPKKAVLHVKSVGLPLLLKSTGEVCDSIQLEPYKPYTVGRKRKFCDLVIADNRVSKRHFQILFDSANKKVYLSDGVVSECNGCNNHCSRSRTSFSLNGVFINGNRASEFVELQVGDVVRLVCGKVDESCGFGRKIGFFVEGIFFTDGCRSSVELDSCIKHSESSNFTLERSRAVKNTRTLLSWCRDILISDNPVSYIRKCLVLDQNKRIDCALTNDSRNFFPNDGSEFCLHERMKIGCGNRKRVFSRDVDSVEQNEDMCKKNIEVLPQEKSELRFNKFVDNVHDDSTKRTHCEGIRLEHAAFVNDSSSRFSSRKKDSTLCTEFFEDNNCSDTILPPGKRFFLNKVKSCGQDGEELKDVVSLPELLHPIESLVRVFITTFTCDILWFLSYCKIPSHLPVTIACHSAERCWSLDPNERSSTPFSDFPNVTVVYPPFPEVLAFNNDQKNSGIACHHPKLMVLQRKDIMRVVITSANLVSKQWHNVTNTVWWQDFPRLIIPDFLSIFTLLFVGNIASKGDFAAQLGGFMASIVADVPSQAYWVLELTNYDFKGAVGYLVASVPGIHSLICPRVSGSEHHLVGNGYKIESTGAQLLTSVEASVVGLNHIYHVSSDCDGALLRKLASLLRSCNVNLDGMSEVVLKRETNIPADWNAVSVFVPAPKNYSLGDSIQLGFLPRHIAKWVAPLSDVGLLAFSAYIDPKEVLATALEGSNRKLKLILYVYMGPSFYDILDNRRLEYAAPICTLLASSQKYLGLGRLKEVLGQYKWPEHLESEFLFSSSSVGSVNEHFLAAFSAAAGKHTISFSESEESDPDWGCWDAHLESKNPSVSIIFPSIERMKNDRSLIMASKRMLCFSEKTWKRLKNIGILHDAVPRSNDRVQFPMHVKVGRRRFQYTKDGTSFGWVYCGSHNFSPAAWGRPISDRQFSGMVTNNSILGSRLHIANYELGIIFIVPPPDMVDLAQQTLENLDDITLPFVVPPPKYRSIDKPATPMSMRDALTELMKKEQELSKVVSIVTDDLVEAEIPEEEEVEALEIAKHDTLEKHDEKAYVDRLWSQAHSSQSN